MIIKLPLIRGAFIAKSKRTVAPGGFYIHNGSSGVKSGKLKRLCNVITNHLGYSCFHYLNMMLQLCWSQICRCCSHDWQFLFSGCSWVLSGVTNYLDLRITFKQQTYSLCIVYWLNLTAWGIQKERQIVPIIIKVSDFLLSVFAT